MAGRVALRELLRNIQLTQFKRKRDYRDRKRGQNNSLQNDGRMLRLDSGWSTSVDMMSAPEDLSEVEYETLASVCHNHDTPGT